ncbi:hypothetical protein BT69DRAFT_402891 [Atractiella rhizophila]|nr:hypothetical protein BT69DRAFT_402891 [Atractiella rhizophila]
MLDLEAEPQAREIDNDEVADNLQKKQVPKRRNKKRRKVARGVEQGSNGEGGVAISSLKATVHQDVPTDTQTTVNRASAAVRARHQEGDRYYQCSHCTNILRVSKASNSNYKGLVKHLHNLSNHRKSLVQFYDLLKAKKDNDLEITQEDVDKAAGRIKITDSDGKTALLQTERLDDILKRLKRQYGSQQFDQRVFDDLLQKVDLLCSLDSINAERCYN